MIVISVSNVGVAFPLALDSSIEIPLVKPHQHPTVSAFLFSVEAVEFEDKNMGDSQFNMKGFSFRFVDRSVTSLKSTNHGTMIHHRSLGLGILFPTLLEIGTIKLTIVSYIPI